MSSYYAKCLTITTRFGGLYIFLVCSVNDLQEGARK